MQITSSFSTSGAAAGAQTSTNQSDYLTFLNMLTVQMQNQDPLNPMDASDFAVQLATFAGVEQQTFTNQLLNAMLGQGGLSDLGSWVGMEARVFGGAWYGGDPVALAPDPALGADSATLIVRDSTGAIVDSRAIDPALQSYQWDGLDSSGSPLPDGTYTFEVESRQGDSILDTQPVAAYVPVLEARYENGATMLVMPGGLMVDSASVTGLRRPAA
ncbi:MAG: flagellar hook assembly protein FlgD [Rhodobacter sp.]|uniref:flagellar hook capping FlgD N-terminal domain-containing protein n=1 Tax=Pararhodobacter sp. TaxID=2127056 RepID=UPI001E066C0D|nr:flagellar hook capping FlgD N-terminal domain-containing protein [Pararhodobacter sp.]MCB1344062.1 flagellar hook assembly protein FlgD [Paracoccaceae bacterium]MCC0072519.1 flagellar hook assembly protein FlgD [Rhodobacter sp.]HPD93432.1 flagellar hook capping FlgD N-terminal domain-containing protein [Pararhodobacter sp.]